LRSPGSIAQPLEPVQSLVEVPPHGFPPVDLVLRGQELAANVLLLHPGRLDLGGGHAHPEDRSRQQDDRRERRGEDGRPYRALLGPAGFACLDLRLETV